ncbi:MAG TPA: LuxR C-terminal-related transcriptional regulator [Ideonella sp.]|uniref:helix-turn-helix transcriptional regulator n=1 Tax=Ideonella sp. TaxID=1929293 RepID=UPI002E34F716|nr:LuxR C-terminal-related transcriptional regulator [Ideonella sp.]HEX5686542.1 LuxR C-terminal-related transcriptional regulator [Ideonella sp.]
MKFAVLARCQSESELTAATEAIVQSLGFDLWAYSAKVIQGPTLLLDWSLHSFPPALWSAYAGESSGSDPITARSKQHMVPMAWLTAQMPTASVDAGGPIDQLHEAARGAGITGGLCLPIHDLAGVIATLTLCTTQPVTQDGLETATTHALLFSKHLHEACRKHVLEAQRSAAPSDLSPREVECLTWASKGKTAWEIGRLLGISEHTAIFHLRNASTKLGTASRQQAVAKSIQLGLLTA